MTEQLFRTALAGLLFCGPSMLSAAEPETLLLGTHSSSRPAVVRPVIDIGGIVGNALRGDVPGIVANAVPPRYHGYVFGYYPWTNYVPRGGYYGYNYYRNYGYAYPYYGYSYGAPAYGYGYGTVDPNYNAGVSGYGAARPFSYDSGANAASGGEAAPPANPSATTATVQEQVRIVNPAANGVTLSFVIDGRVYTLPAGQHLDVAGGPDRVVAFDRGESRGAARYTLRGGTYTFTPSESGWELYQSSSRAGEEVPAPSPTSVLQ